MHFYEHLQLYKEKLKPVSLYRQEKSLNGIFS